MSFTNLDVGRLIVSRKQPYLSSILWALQPIARPGLGTVATDRFFRFYYDPEIVASWNDLEVAGALVHECNHLLLDHARRIEGAGLDPQLGNLAADLVVNPSLLADGFQLPPPGGIFPRDFDLPENQSMQQYYDLLQNRKLPVPEFGRGACGSCAHGQAGPHEEDDMAQAIPLHEAECIRQHVAEAVREAAQKGRGTLPGWLERWAESFFKPEIPWRTRLQARVRNAWRAVAGNTDYTYSRRSRRQDTCPDILLPGMHHPTPFVGFLLDTSGSMSAQELSQGLAEIGGILKTLMGSSAIQVYTGDTAVATQQTIFHPRQVRLIGGGGTDMAAAITQVAHSKPRPQLLIVYTDGETSFPERPLPGMQVLVAFSRADAPQGPPWIEASAIRKH